MVVEEKGWSTRYSKCAWYPLEAGVSYELQGLHKEGWGGDHIRVRWKRPDGATEEPIPASRCTYPCAAVSPPPAPAAPPLPAGFKCPFKCSSGDVRYGFAPGPDWSTL